MRKTLEFIKRNSSIILTSHEGADADGIGAELLMAHILENMGKEVRIINAEPTVSRYAFMNPKEKIEVWDEAKHGGLLKKSALIIVDTSDEYHIGVLKAILPKVKETLVIDHHEPNPFSNLAGYIDPAASSTCEIIIDIAKKARITLDTACATAAFAGISYDTGSFAYKKTTAKTFKAALALIKAGAVPSQIYSALNENDSLGALLLQKQVLSSLKLHNLGRIAVQILKKEDLEATGGEFDEAEAFINVPLKSREVEVSIFIKENRKGIVRCSLRSKGQVNVSKIAQQFGGGGHATAAGFKSSQGIDETLVRVLEKIKSVLDT
ncbi:MAG: bifunctional oligoribonuclease/PAP phosphatase NrnA [Treponema sp.]|jgi:phosphoesterase RecJ-like protein|nr:bifunctional oligoribonuclease/PAP phosphatase NrnA [Treponema sp.]